VKTAALRLEFDHRLRLQFHGSVITPDGGLLAYRELNDVPALTASGGERLTDERRGNASHQRQVPRAWRNKLAV
jgi:hypothetical protein